MSQPTTIDPVLAELVRELARDPHSQLLRGPSAANAPVRKADGPEAELLRVYRTQAAQLLCAAALDCLRRSFSLRDFLFLTPGTALPSIDHGRVVREQQLSQGDGAFDLLLRIYQPGGCTMAVTPEHALQLARYSRNLFPSAVACMIEADVNLHRNRMDSAERACNEGIAIALRKTQRARLHERLAVIARRRRQKAAYLERTKLASDLDPESLPLCWTALRASLEAGDHGESLRAGAALEVASDRHPQHAQLLTESLRRLAQARNRPASITLGSQFEMVRPLLGTASRGMIDAFA